MIDLDKFICSLLNYSLGILDPFSRIHDALAEQGLEYKDGAIKSIEKEGKPVIIDAGFGSLTVHFNEEEMEAFKEGLKKKQEATIFTIKDVKAGDVLSYNDGHGNDCIELIKSVTDKKIEFWFCLTNGNRYEVFDGFTPYTNFASREDAIPATKEQRDLLFQKMKETGYEWDAEKKELKKIEQKSAENKGMNLVEEEMTSFQKKVFCIIDTTIEEEQGLKQVCDELLALASNEIKQKPAWSEEDEIGLYDALWCCKQAASIAKDENDMGNIWYAERWLKSLKERYTWKPSDEQMKALDKAMYHVDDSIATQLAMLIGDLKKLN